MTDYDAWKTTPADERGYCPHCHISSEDAELVCENDWDVYRCTCCGSTYAEPIGHAEMVREAEIEARLDRAGL